MKIVVTGAAKTGVTSTASLIPGKEFTFIEEAATQALIAGFKLDKKVTRETELWIATKQLEMEMNAGENFVSDRCFIDIYAYADYFFNDDRPLKAIIGKMTYDAIQKYDVVIYLPAGQFPIMSDGIRDTRRNYQRLIDRRIRGVLAHFDKKYYRVTGTIPERIKQIDKILKAGAA